MKQTKIEMIEQLSLEKLSNLLNILLSKLGYEDITTEQDLITAKLKTPLSTSTHRFLLLTEKLSGISETEKAISYVSIFTERDNFNHMFIVSPNHISNGFKNNIRRIFSSVTIEFLDRDAIIDLIDGYFPDYWKHDDSLLVNYERFYVNEVIQGSEIKKLKIFKDKYEKLLDIFVEPNIYHIYEDKDTKTMVRKRVSIDAIAAQASPQIVAGNAGTGKTTILKRIGKAIIDKNTDLSKKNLPIFITVEEIFDNDYKLDKVIKNKLSPFFENIDELIFSSYNITLLIDTIDELEEEHQKKVLNKLELLWKTNKVNYIIATRNPEKILSYAIAKNIKDYNIQKFNFEQIKKFVGLFFKDQQHRSEELLEALRENRIIDKLPITPLTLSLLSILYEENNLEIPATITDIYDNFNALLLGKAIVSSRIEFIDISFKERILSLYALELLQRKEHHPMTIDEFYTFFENYFKNKTIPLRKGTLQDVLNDLITNTGILLIKHNTYVHYSHDSFMEYYTAQEIFKHQRHLEELYIRNFFEANWQNSAVFYAGKSKDMPHFLEKITDRLQNSSKHNEFIMGVFGMGYLLQALYQTDNIIRRDAVLAAIDSNIKFHEILLKLASDDVFQFRKFTLPTLWIMNIIYFYESFNSVSLKTPLKESFKILFNEYLNSKTSPSISADTTKGYKAFKVAMTLSSKRINDTEELEKMVFESDLTSDPILSLLGSFTLSVLGSGNDSFKEMKKELKKEFHRFKEPIKTITEVPAGRLRFSALDQIRTERKIKILTEGPTDVEILSHAYSVLTEGELPYWQISVAGNKSGGAHEVNKSLLQAKPILNKDETLIGIFDRDSAGLKEYHMLDGNFFYELKPSILKKHQEADIYALCIPICEDRIHYLQKDQNFNFFSIEHYFDEDLLRNQNLLVELPISDIFAIRDKGKTEFSKFIRTLSTPSLFKRFIDLFKLIDEIAGKEIEYIEQFTHN